MDDHEDEENEHADRVHPVLGAHDADWIVEDVVEGGCELHLGQM